MNIEEEITEIKTRNQRVELDKAWETSKTRKLLVCLITYTFVVITMYSLKIEKPLINAIIPTLGFFLSTLTIRFAKNIWIKKQK